MSREAMQLALEALEDYVEEYGPHEKDSGAAYVITALRQALETEKQWVGLGENEIFSILENLQTIYNRPPTEDSRIIFARAIEAKLKEKNT